MIESIIHFIANGFMWLLFSEKGREWMPFILYVSLIWSVSFAIWVFFRKDD